jgi:D-alanyl-D-alanine carboxypeptidase/D-alanyl-D-alanine-endopeptidase (penicillin-binding protein 4)
MDERLPHSVTRYGWKLAGLLILLPLVALANPELPVGVRSVLNLRNVPDSSLSVYVEDVDSGELVLAWNDKQARNPASVEKMLTTLVALDTLGPAYRWKTEAFALGEIDGTRLNGDLLLKGYGDPMVVPSASCEDAPTVTV